MLTYFSAFVLIIHAAVLLLHSLYTPDLLTRSRTLYLATVVITLEIQPMESFLSKDIIAKSVAN
jgi:hypothetical protein